MRKCDFGGQAVIEGILMMGKRYYVIAVRKAGKIIVKKEKIKPLLHVETKANILKWPLIRGIVALLNTLVIGIKALSWSAMQAGEEEAELTARELLIVFVSAFLLSLLLFVALPFGLTKLVPVGDGIMFNLVDGLFRVIILVGYIWVISRFDDVKVLFQYHGAEHKAINCYESGKKLSVENCSKFSTLHPRCGTSFLMIVVLISIIVFSMVTDPRWWIKLMSRIVLIPVIAGVSYEVLKLSAKYRNNLLIKILIAPGLFLQRISTHEPDDSQIEVGIKALQELVKLEKSLT